MNNQFENIDRILCVDDDSIFVSLLKELLEKNKGFEVKTANSVKESLVLLDENCFDVIVSDYEMPESDGLEFLSLLKQKGNDTPFILLTGKGREEVVIKALNLGADRYIQKGVDTESMIVEVVDSINRIVSNKRRITEYTNNLKHSATELDSLFNSTKDIMIIVSNDNTVLKVNKNALISLGLSEEQFVGKKCYKVVHKTNAPISDCPCKQSFHTKTYQSNIIKTNGGWLKLEAYPIFENNKISSFLHRVEDISEQKKIEEKLIENEAKYRSLVENASDYFFLVDKNYKLVSLNKAAKNFIGKINGEIIGKSLKQIFPKQIAEQFIEDIKHVFKTGKESFIESNIVVGGKNIWLSTKLAPIKNSEIHFVMGISRNITLEKVTEKLKLDTLKQVTAGISHDLRNPLATISNALYILKDASEEKKQEMFAMIKKSVDSMSTMLKNFTEFEKEIILNLEQTDILCIIKESLGYLVFPDNIKIDIADVSVQQINIDQEKIRRSLLNILQNSIQAMPEGGILKITTKKINNMAEIGIKDTGIGISKKNLTKMFTPFFSTREGGIGLGLVNTKRIIESHKGTIKIKSEKNKGTTITINLPLVS